MSQSHVRVLHTTVATPFAAAYEFAHQPENFPKWAAGLSKDLHHTDRGWVANTPVGEAIVRFTEPNPYGVLDHHVQLPDKPEMYIPLRLVAHGDETVVELVLFRLPDMTDEQFEHDAALVEADLAALKKLLEGPTTDAQKR